jgi:hypothetical protein
VRCCWPPPTEYSAASTVCRTTPKAALSPASWAPATSLKPPLSERRPGAEVLAMGTWVHTVHALTALALAVGDRDRARLTDSAVAGLWATAGYHDLTRARATPPPTGDDATSWQCSSSRVPRAGASCAAESTKIAESKPC